MPYPSTFVAEQPPEHDHALVAGQGLPQALAQLQAGGGGLTVWLPPLAVTGYGETWVQDLLHTLAETGADLLVLPAPDSPAPWQRSLALAGLEAARRHICLACTWVSRGSTRTEGPLLWTCLPAIEPGEPSPTWPLPGPLRDTHNLPREANAPSRVSVIVRSMDRATLDEALESIAVQTYPNVEVVVVNALGVGHQELPSYCGSFSLQLTPSTDGRPLPRAHAANRGLNYACGDLALFLDDDDLLLPDHLAKLVAALHAQPDAVAAFADVEMGHDEAGRWHALHTFNAAFDPIRLLFENYLPIHAVLFRHTTGLQLDESFDLFEDWDFWLQLAQTARFVHAPGVSARYRVHGLQQSNVFNDTPIANQARAALVDKWRLRLSPAQYRAALQRLQQLHRSSAQTLAELALAREGAAAQLAVLQAREREIEAAQVAMATTRKLVQAREQELAHALVEIKALRDMLALREAESTAAGAHASNLSSLLASRENETADARAHIAGLESILAARVREVGDASEHAAQLRAVVAARDEEIANLHSHATQLEQRLAAQAVELNDRALALTHQAARLSHSEQELAALRAETPLLALRRTIRKKKHATTER